MKGLTSGQYDTLWVLSALDQLCSGIYNDEIPLVQVVTALRILFVTKQQEHQSVTSFREEFEQNIMALAAVGATIKHPESCFKLEEQLDPNNTLKETKKQDRAFDHVMALTFLTQCGHSAELTRTMLKTQYVQQQDHYPASITIASSLLWASSKPVPRTNRGPACRQQYQQQHPRSSAERPCDVCGSPDHWAPNCPSRARAPS